MLAASLLVLAVAAAQEGALPAPREGDVPSAPPAAETVRAVRVESPDRERLLPFVDLAPGAPLDAEAVRRAVELMFATGRFEDVVVDVVREAGESGVLVVFRPLPAPLLVAVRIEGDRVVSAGQAARIARLRAGDPLWPSRLDRAARDVGIALAQRGHLEALVEPRTVPVPGGAEALFRVHAGPRVRVGRAVVEGAEAVPVLRLDAQVRPRPGEVFRRDKAEAARDTMRRLLVRADHWRAAVELRETYDPGRGLVDLVFRVSPGPRMTLEARGAAVPAKLLAQVRGLVRDGGATSDSLEAGAERLETHLRDE
ncbi:MAG TPA: POTRA domain-containing protein, partial [Vicinamibacteria bacterium]|nr:POTRA domain-containing protein [Vicinamibacteria bacterium]